MLTTELADIPRLGNCIDDPALVDELSILASKVCESSDDPLEFCAPTVEIAAAWLLCLGHWFASDWNTELSFQRHLGRGTGLLSFRGQKWHFGNLSPRLCRDVPDKRAVRRAHAWIRILVEVWHDRHFEYALRTADPRSFWPGADEAEAVSQHYDIPTELLDWTVDPLVALCFACGDLKAGQQGVVVIEEQDWRPMEDYHPLLPPTFVSRLWRQRGIFKRRYCEIEKAYKPYKAHTRLRILNGFDGLLRAGYERLMNDPENLQPIATWALKTGEITEAPTWLAGFQSEIPQIVNERVGLPVPEGLLRTTPKFREDVKSMAELIDLMALRLRFRIVQYDVELLCNFFEALYGDASLKRDASAALGAEDARGTLFSRVADRPNYYREILSRLPEDFSSLPSKPHNCISPIRAS